MSYSVQTTASLSVICLIKSNYIWEKEKKNIWIVSDKIHHFENLQVKGRNKGKAVAVDEVNLGLKRALSALVVE